MSLRNNKMKIVVAKNNNRSIRNAVNASGNNAILSNQSKTNISSTRSIATFDNSFDRRPSTRSRSSSRSKSNRQTRGHPTNREQGSSSFSSRNTLLHSSKTLISSTDGCEHQKPKSAYHNDIMVNTLHQSDSVLLSNTNMYLTFGNEPCATHKRNTTDNIAITDSQQEDHTPAKMKRRGRSSSQGPTKKPDPPPFSTSKTSVVPRENSQRPVSHQPDHNIRPDDGTKAADSTITYEIGVTLIHPTHSIPFTSSFQASILLTKLPLDSPLFVKRTSGEWTYAVLVDRYRSTSDDPKSDVTSLTVILGCSNNDNHKRNKKILQRSKWERCLRLVHPEYSASASFRCDASTETSSRTTTGKPIEPVGFHFRDTDRTIRNTARIPKKIRSPHRAVTPEDAANMSSPTISTSNRLSHRGNTTPDMIRTANSSGIRYGVFTTELVVRPPKSAKSFRCDISTPEPVPRPRKSVSFRRDISTKISDSRHIPKEKLTTSDNLPSAIHRSKGIIDREGYDSSMRSIVDSTQEEITDDSSTNKPPKSSVSHQSAIAKAASIPIATSSTSSMPSQSIISSTPTSIDTSPIVPSKSDVTTPTKSTREKQNPSSPTTVVVNLNAKNFCGSRRDRMRPRRRTQRTNSELSLWQLSLLDSSSSSGSSSHCNNSMLSNSSGGSGSSTSALSNSIWGSSTYMVTPTLDNSTMMLLR